MDQESKRGLALVLGIVLVSIVLFWGINTALQGQGEYNCTCFIVWILAVVLILVGWWVYRKRAQHNDKLDE